MEDSFCLTHPPEITLAFLWFSGKMKIPLGSNSRGDSCSSNSCGDAAFLSGAARGGFRGTHVAGASCSHAVADKAPVPGAGRIKIGCFKEPFDFLKT